MSDQQQEIIIFKEHRKPDSSILLEIELNNSKKLNVLNLEIICSLNKAIRVWREKRELSLVFIHSAGNRAFCAGGDVSQVYRTILKSKKEGKDPALAVRSFFHTEYETDYMISQFPTPVVLWGAGIVMGGGMGLFSAVSHPIVTETSLLAMPEVSIGFFPDVGASHFLNEIHSDFGRYLALTACRLNASEACFLGLSQWAFYEEEKQKFFEFLKNSSFNSKEEFNRQFSNFYKEPSFLSQQECWFKNFQEDISKALEFKDIKSFYNYLSSAKKEDKKWEQNRKNFLKASPTSLALVFEQLKRAKNQKDMKLLFEMECVIAGHCANSSDFLEGVRALLIDKTNDPQWNPARIEDIEQSEIDKYFIADKNWDFSLKV